MNGSKYGKKSQFTTQNILVWIVGILLMLTMISTWLLSNLFAKYVGNDADSDSARVAAGGQIELWEHEAELKNGIYVLNETKKFEGNTYEKTIPGVDIAKDPRISLDLEYAEVDYELYVKVTESDYFPATVTYELTDNWKVYDESKGIYKYKGYFDAGTPDIDDIQILKDDTLYVSEHYVGKDQDGNDQQFSLTFTAWLKQVD